MTKSEAEKITNLQERVQELERKVNIQEDQIDALLRYLAVKRRKYETPESKLPRKETR